MMTVPLGEAVDFLDHLRRPINQADRIPGATPYYGANGQQDSVEGYIFDEPLVLLAEDGGQFDQPAKGIAYRISGKSWVNNHAHVLRPRSTVDIAYLTRVLENKDVRAYVSGSTRGKLTKANAARILIPLPPLPEQRRIASILDQADAIRAQRLRALSLLDVLTDSLFEMSFTRDTWPVAPLSKVALTQGGLTVNRHRSALSVAVPYLRVANVMRGHLDLAEVKLMGVTDKELERVRLQAGDVLIVEGHGNVDEVGRAALWPESALAAGSSMHDCVHQNHLIRVRPLPAKMDSLFLVAHLNSLPGRRYFRSVAKTTSGLNTINMQNVKDVPVPIPPLSVQTEFGHKVHAIDITRRRHQQHLAKLDELFASLQHRAFTGQL